jgi:YVTN family beta-propeller protein
MKVAIICLLLLFLTACNNIQNTTFEAPKLEGRVTTMKLIQTIPMPGVEGQIDHLSVDMQGKRLFVAALGNNTVKVLDLNTSSVVHSISDLSEPQ